MLSKGALHSDNCVKVNRRKKSDYEEIRNRIKDMETRTGGKEGGIKRHYEHLLGVY